MNNDKIKIFAHRGFWDDFVKPNSKDALLKALTEGFSTETDIRDFGGMEIGISHDPICIDHEFILTLDEFLDIFKQYSNNDSLVAFNIKADGLESLLLNFKQLLEDDRFFFFDGSFPSMKRLKESNLKCLDRISEFESPSSYNFDGIWVDAFKEDWVIESDQSILRSYANVIFVSPELHNRPHQTFWRWLKNYNIDNNQIFGICTDYPDKAKVYFND